MQLLIFKYEEENKFENLTTIEIDGELWFLAADVCRLLGMSNAPREVSSLEEEEKLLYEIRIAGQMRKANFVNESGLYALIFRSKKESAKKFRKWVTKEVIPAIRTTGGYGEKKQETPVLLATYSARLLSEPTKSVPRGWWSVFDRSHSIMLTIEKYVGSVSKYDLVDGSIGIRWAAYRKTQPWCLPSSNYQHEYDDNRGTRLCHCYRNEEGMYFDDWLKYVYQPTYLYEYLHNKYTKEKNVYMLNRVEKAMPKLLKAAS